jgi:hypothetical protein
VQRQSPNTRFTFELNNNVSDSHGRHSPELREPVGAQESDSSSFHFSLKRYVGVGSTYGNYKYLNIPANPNYSDDSIYGPGYDDPSSTFYGWI